MWLRSAWATYIRIQQDPVPPKQKPNNDVPLTSHFNISLGSMNVSSKPVEGKHTTIEQNLVNYRKTCDDDLLGQSKRFVSRQLLNGRLKPAWAPAFWSVTATDFCSLPLKTRKLKCTHWPWRAQVTKAMVCFQPQSMSDTAKVWPSNLQKSRVGARQPSKGREGVLSFQNGR